MTRILPTKRPLSGRTVRRIGLGAAMAGLGVAGCVLELPELREEAIGGFSGNLPFPGAGAAGALSGGFGGQAGGIGGLGGSSGVTCSAGQKLCNGICQPTEVEFGCGQDSCNPCPQLQNGTVGCSAAGQCILVSCDEGFADCNADASSGADLQVSNGCEYSFGAVADPAPPLRVPEQTMTVDGVMDDWLAVPSYPLRQVCTDSGCGSDDFAPITAFGTLPLRRDLDAYFRVAWDRSFLYLVLEAHDDDIYADSGTRADPQCNGPADCEDSMTLFFDGFDERAPGQSYGQSGRRIVLGLGNQFTSKTSNPEGGQVGIQGQTNGPACYRIEAQVSWEYLVAQGNPPESQFPIREGNTYGFDLSVNDWDTDLLSDPVQVRRQSHVFWLDPGDDYRFLIQGFGELQLVGPPSAQQ